VCVCVCVRVCTHTHSASSLSKLLKEPDRDKPVQHPPSVELPNETEDLLLCITAVPNTKLCAWGEEDSGGHVLRETTSRGLCGLD
jgi:hypothetical protein